MNTRELCKTVMTVRERMLYTFNPSPNIEKRIKILTIGAHL